MPTFEPITPTNALAYKTVRLWALQDSPRSFGSTYARESQFTDADWIKRAANLNTERSVGYLAMEDGNYCGIAGAFLDEQNPLRADLVSMWVAPAARRMGVGGALIDAIRSMLQVARSAYAAVDGHEREP